MNSQHTAITYTIPDAVKVSGLSRTRLYLLLQAGEIEAKRVGKHTLVLADSLRGYILRQPKAEFRAPRQRVAEQAAA